MKGELFCRCRNLAWVMLSGESNTETKTNFPVSKGPRKSCQTSGAFAFAGMAFSLEASVMLISNGNYPVITVVIVSQASSSEQLLERHSRLPVVEEGLT